MSREIEIENKQNFVQYGTWLRNRQTKAHNLCDGVHSTSYLAPTNLNLEPANCKTPSYFEPKILNFDLAISKPPKFTLDSSSDESTSTFSSAPESTTELQINHENPKTETENVTIHGPFEEFSSDLLSLLNDTSSFDVTIECDDEALKVHRIILSARSPVFKALFSSSVRESAEWSIVSIDDLKPESLRDLICFIYSNQVHDLSVPKACDLLYASEKYQVQSLKRICIDFLICNLSVQNALLILQNADLYDDKLKMHTMKFIIEKFSDLKGMEEWKTMQSHNPTLALEVFNMVLEHFK